MTYIEKIEREYGNFARITNGPNDIMLDWKEFRLLTLKYLYHRTENNRPRRTVEDLISRDYDITDDVRYRDREALMIIEKKKRKRGPKGMEEWFEQVAIAKDDFEHALEKLGYITEYGTNTERTTYLTDTVIRQETIIYPLRQETAQKIPA